jgi:serine protease Do
MQNIQEDQRYVQPVSHPLSPPTRKRRKSLWVWLALTLIVAAMVVIVAIIQAKNFRGGGSVPELPPSRAVSTSEQPSPAELSRSFREVVRGVKDAVVFINVVERVDERSNDNSPFGFPLPSPDGPRRREGAGSGFIVTEDGYILTNNHVVNNATKINVTLADGRKYKAEVIGTDTETDIAVIKIDVRSLPIAVLGESDKVQQGDWVLALGSPFGLQQTLTAGIVSATGRELRDSQFNHYIQTDASINPGNSGGPLVDMQGEVIGINTMILTGGDFSRGNIGIGFAIASNEARKVFETLVRGGKVSRGYLGVLVGELDPAKASALSVEAGSGVFVSGVPDPNSPAGKAGIKSRDVITAFNGKAVRQPRELTETVAATPVGSSARVDFIRDGKPQSVTVELAERPASVSARAVQPDQEPGDGGSVVQGGLGIKAQTVTPDTAERMKLKNASGVLVVAVEAGGPAADAGVRHGDVIHSIHRTEVKTVEDLAAAVKSLDKGEYMLEVERGGQVFFLTVTFE